METRAANNQGSTVGKEEKKVTIPGGIAGEVHENSIQEKAEIAKFHPFLEEQVHPFILNIYKDYSVRGYFIMILVSFIAIAIVVGIALGIYLAFAN